MAKHLCLACFLKAMIADPGDGGDGGKRGGDNPPPGGWDRRPDFGEEEEEEEPLKLDLSKLSLG